MASKSVKRFKQRASRCDRQTDGQTMLRRNVRNVSQ